MSVRRSRPWTEPVLRRRYLQAIVAIAALICQRPAAAGVREVPLVSHKGVITFTKPPYKLCVGSIFKNEADNLAEWLLHYSTEGVDQFFLIDNNSTDTYPEILKVYSDAGWITLWTDNKRHAQTYLTDFYFTPVSHMCDWFAVMDLDEFAFARHSLTMTEYLQNLPPTVGSVTLAWKMFGSSGHAVQPSHGVVAGFTKRRNDSYDVVKSISRPYAVQDFSDYHLPALHSGYSRVFPTFEPNPQATPYAKRYLSNDELLTHALHLNHYSIQSRDWFQRVKVPRGDNQHPENDQGRDMQHFARMDFAEVTDEELAKKRNGFLRI